MGLLTNGFCQRYKETQVMVKSKGWDWQAVDNSIWLDPCEESYYYVNKWKKAGCKSVLDLGCGYGWHCKYAVR